MTTDHVGSMVAGALSGALAQQQSMWFLLAVTVLVVFTLRVLRNDKTPS